MTGRWAANTALVALSCLMWFGVIHPDLLRLQEGVVLKHYGYLYYNATLALFDIAAALGATIAAIVSARAAVRGGAGERSRSVTVGALGVLVVQVIIAVMIPLGYFLGVHFY